MSPLKSRCVNQKSCRFSHEPSEVSASPLFQMLSIINHFVFTGWALLSFFISRAEVSKTINIKLQHCTSPGVKGVNSMAPYVSKMTPFIIPRNGRALL